jgi:CheY-like chemotaxis protein
MISARHQEKEAFAVGVNGFIQKPFVVKSFLNSVSEALK